MKPNPLAPYFVVCIIAWVALAIGSWKWISSRPSTEEKRLWFRRSTIISGLFFGTFITFISIQWHHPFALLIFLPAIVLIGFLNLRVTFFCDGCGKMTQSQDW